MTEPVASLTAEQEAMMLGLMVDTFGIPESRAKLYILRFRGMALEAEGDALLAHGDRMDPQMAERVLTTFLARARALDEQFKEVNGDD